ncbi:acyltransferase family protein [Fusobacterium sp. PH5-44]|uniref:acyltransferase family protein n=1 Tax=unclassified Fusobacterium TaxID=2648384 RepID=UPI003D261820
MDNKRFGYIDGLKGILCFIVAINHFQNLYKLPLRHHIAYATIFNGSYAVAVFLLLSNFFISLKIFKIESIVEIKKMIIGRYLRVSLPVFFISLIILILYKLQLFSQYKNAVLITGGGDPALHFNSINLFNVFINSFLRCLFKRSSDFTFVLWMLPYLFLGNLISIIIAVLIKSFDFIKASLITIFTVYVLMINNFHSLYLVAPLGVYFGYIINKGILKARLGYLLIMVGLYFIFIPHSHSKIELVFKSIKYYNPTVIHIFSGFLLLLGLSTIKFLKKFLEIKFFLHLGKISLSIFLVHQLLTTSFCSIVFIKLVRYFSLTNSKIILLILYILMTILLSSVFYSFVEQNCNKLVKKYLNN